ncbi:MAG: TetR family transcriptional regulator [Acidimicrobiales bacterium]
MRIDAQRNHEHIVDAARELFAKEGTKVSVEAIARAAGVGVGTVHRHFPTKDSLLDAVLIWFCEPMVEALDAALVDDDPAAGLEAYLVAVVEILATHRALAEELRGRHQRGEETDELTALKAGMTERLEQLLASGQASGQIRSDIVVGDLRLLMAGLAQTATVDDDSISVADRVRVARIVIDGLRTGPTPTT